MKKTPKIIPLILCGGAGTRLWPLSRELYPKQLLSLVNEHSLLQNTVTRCADHPDVVDPILVCNEEHRFLVAEQLREIDIRPGTIILEPEGRNTAPAIALGAHLAARQDEDAILIVLPSDHVMPGTDAFHKALTTAIDLAKKDYLATFGVAPDRPETAYGYIGKGDVLDDAWLVDAFTEKPDAETALDYFQSGRYYWNSGIFVFKAGVYLQELATHRPDIAMAVKNACESVQRDMDFTRVDAGAFLKSPAESIDYAVMEHTRRAAVVPSPRPSPRPPRGSPCPGG